MTPRDRSWFKNLACEMPAEVPGHEIRIEVRGTTCRVRCECGELLGGGTGCNRSGMDYVVGWSAAAYKKHVEAARVDTPAPLRPKPSL